MAHSAHGASTLLPSTSVGRAHQAYTSQKTWKPFVCVDPSVHSRTKRHKTGRSKPRAPAGQQLTFRVYRDQGTLSEIDIVECLAEDVVLQLPRVSAELSGGPCSASAEGAPSQRHKEHAPDTTDKLTSLHLHHGVPPSSHKGALTSAQKMAQQRRLRHRCRVSASQLHAPDWNGAVQLNQLGSSILERQPKVQLAYQLQGCVTECTVPLLQPEPHSTEVLSGDKQLQLWHRFAAGRDAEKGIVAMHTHLGYLPSGKLAATALGFDTSGNLAKCLQDGQAAKAKLMATNMGLVRKLAGQYSCTDAPFRDLMQEGIWGLDRGLEMYDPSRQAKVSTALYWYIRDAVRKAKLLQSTAIHIPLTTHEQMDKLRAVMRDWRKQHPGQQITAAELSELTSMRQPTLTRVMQASLLSERSLDLPVTTGHSTGFGSDAQANWVDKIAGDELDEQVFYAQADLKSAVAQLPDPMSVIVQEKYGLLDGHAKNFKEVADLLHIKKWKVQQYYRTAMQTLQAQSGLRELAHAI